MIVFIWDYDFFPFTLNGTMTFSSALDTGQILFWWPLINWHTGPINIVRSLTSSDCSTNEILVPTFFNFWALLLVLNYSWSPVRDCLYPHPKPFQLLHSFSGFVICGNVHYCGLVISSDYLRKRLLLKCHNKIDSNVSTKMVFSSN